MEARPTNKADEAQSRISILVGFAAILSVLLTAVFLAHGGGEPAVRQAVRWTARTSLLWLCAALLGEGLRGSFFGWTRRAEILRCLALSHAVHACFVAALAVLEGGRSLVQRSSPVDVLGGALASGAPSGRGLASLRPGSSGSPASSW